MAGNSATNLNQIVQAFETRLDINSQIFYQQVPGDVTIEDGTQRPNLEKRIRQLLANINLYSDATTGNNASKDGDFFGVPRAQSNGTQTIDLYQRINGVATLRLGGMQPTGDGLANIPSGGSEHIALGGLLTVNQQKNWRDSLNQQPGVVGDPNFVCSNLIDVKKGDCFCLTYSHDSSGVWPENLVAFYQNGNALGSLVWCTRLNSSDPVILDALDQRGNKYRQLQKWFRVPEDGQIRVSMTSVMAYGGYLSKTSVESFIEAMVWRGAALNAHRWDRDDVLYTPLLTSLAVDYDLTHGDTPIIQSQNSAMSDWIPVKAGQFLNAVIPHYNYSGIIRYFDTDKKFYQNLDSFNSVTGSYAFAGTTNGEETAAQGGIVTLENYQFPKDGFIRIQVDVGATGWNDGLMYRIDDEWVDYVYPYTSETNPVARFNGYVSSAQGRNFSPATSASYAKVDNPTDCDVLCDIYIRKGTIARLEYVVTNPDDDHNLILFPQNPTNFEQNWTYIYGPTIGFEPGNNPPKGTTKVCYVYAQDCDIPATMYTAAGTGRVEILTQDEFVARRNADIAALKPVTGMQPDNIALPYGDLIVGPLAKQYMGVGWIPMLPHEVLFFKSNYSVVRAFTLGLFNAPLPSDPNTPLWTTEDNLFNLTSSILGAQWDNNLTGDQSRLIQNRGSFIYAGFQCYDPLDANGNQTVDWSNYFGNDFPRVMSQQDFLSEYQDGDDLPQGWLPDNSWRSTWDATGKNLSVIGGGFGSDDQWRGMYPFVVIAGQCYEWTCNTDRSASHATPYIAYINDLDDNSNHYEIKPLVEVSQTPNGDFITPQRMTGYIKPKKSGIVFMSSRHLSPSEPTDQDYSFYIGNQYKLSMRVVSDEVYRRNTEIDFDEKVLFIPNETGIELKIVNGAIPYDRDGGELTFPMQLWVNGAHQCTFLATGHVSGQGSAGTGYSKVNVTVHGKNKSGKKIKFKIGDWPETKKLTLKAFLEDRSYVRDTLGNLIFREVREASSETVIPQKVFEKNLLDYPSLESLDQYPGTCLSSPCTLYAGNQVHGIYVIRFSDDGIGYGIVDNDKDFIGIESDHLAYGQRVGDNVDRQITWDSPSYQEWDIPYPSKLTGSSYQTGDTPADDNGVKTAIDWLLNFISDCYNGKADFDTDAEKHLDMQSCIDYLITNEVLMGWDSQRNNRTFVTYNASESSPVWYAFMYDLDSTLGKFGSDPTPSNKLMCDSNSSGPEYLIRKSGKWWPIACENWKARRSDIFSDVAIKRMMTKSARTIPDTWYSQDRDNWSADHSDNSGYIRQFLLMRVQQLDNLFK